MASSQKVSLVSYRRNSSDMELSSSEEDDGQIVTTVNTKSDNIDRPSDKGLDDNIHESSIIDNIEKNKIFQSSQFTSEERLHGAERRDSRNVDNRRDNGKRDRSSPDRSKKDRRRSDSERRREDDDPKRSQRGKDRCSSPDRKRRKSRDRSRGRSPGYHHRHRSRSPGRSKHSPDRRDHRKRSHSPDRRSYKSRRSPEMSFRSKRLEKKAARIDRLGLELIAEPKKGVRPFLDSHSKDGETSSGGYFNPGATNAARIAEQIQKRRLLWGSNKKEPAAEPVCDQPGSSGTGKTWEAATFKGDNDGKMTEKFKRLMGIKGEGGGAPVDDGDSIIQKQEEMFSNMEAQYQVARMATHTHRGIGLGFGTFQVPPR